MTANRASVGYKPKNTGSPTTKMAQSKSQNEGLGNFDPNSPTTNERITRASANMNLNPNPEFNNFAVRNNSSKLHNLMDKLEKNEDLLHAGYTPSLSMPRLNSSNTPRFMPQLSNNTNMQPRRNLGMTNFNTQNSLIGAMAFHD